MIAETSLDGVWEFFPGDHDADGLHRLEPEAIRVPGLWEAQGHRELDGVAWYRRRFRLRDASGWWTLRFGAVMDLARVWLNGVEVGSHECGFTPFELDVTGVLAAGVNTLAVRVDDPPAGHPDHLRSAHGKQGWANHAYPSPPSLYGTYGGIWQPVILRRHGPAVVRDLFVDGDPADLVVTLVVDNRSSAAQHATVRLALLGTEREEEVDLAPGEHRLLRFSLGATAAPRWSPRDPVLHEAVAEAVVGAGLSDRAAVRFGLRTVRVSGRRLVLNGEPWRMRAALVQGFGADELYAEGADEAIRDEILAARAMGFDTLRLHLKAFDPRYLDACDELGMLVHADLPVGEPVDYAELGADTTLARRCVAAAREQVVRDRNHPSIVLWTAMNEIGERRADARASAGYEAFVRAVHAAVVEADPTRPAIENDWVEPDPERVHASPLVTAHWYGRLHGDWLDKLERKLARCAVLRHVFLLTELGDWGLPDLDEPRGPRPWDARELWAGPLSGAGWPESTQRFVAGAQRYQGLSDRLQVEVARRHDHVAGYCVTELTDVPQELNGLLDVHRRPKPPAVVELARANQPVLPMLDLRTLTVEAGARLEAPLHVANDGPALADVEVDLGATRVRVGELAAHRAAHVGSVGVAMPSAPGRHELVLRLRAGGRELAENRYPLWVVDPPPRADAGVLVVGEDALDRDSAAAARERLAEGATVVVLAQRPEAARWYPLPVALTEVETRWGQGFLFTTGAALTALPPTSVLAGEDATLHARALVTHVDGAPFPERPLVVRLNGRGTTGTVVGTHPVGPGRLVLCQFRVEARARAGDPAARALLSDLAALGAPHTLRR